MDTTTECCVCGQLTDADITTLIENELIVREINEEYGIPSTHELHGGHIGIICDLCKETLKGLGQL